MNNSHAYTGMVLVRLGLLFGVRDPIVAIRLSPQSGASFMSRTAMLFAAALLLALPVQLDGQSSWNELVDLFSEWREFERPEFIDGGPA